MHFCFKEMTLNWGIYCLYANMKNFLGPFPSEMIKIIF